MSSRPALLLLGAALLIPACSGNINDGKPAVLVTSRVSVSTTGAQGNGPADGKPSISEDGRFVAFDSLASDLVPGDTNGFRDVFLHDRRSGITRKVSQPQGGGDANGASRNPSVSGKGEFVVFESDATNLGPADSSSSSDIYLWDASDGSITRVSLLLPSTESDGPSTFPVISRDGNFVAFVSAATNLDATSPGFDSIYRWSRAGGAIVHVSQADGGGAPDSISVAPSISGDGAFIAYHSFAGNLLAAPYTNAGPDVFLWDSGGPTRRVSEAAGGLVDPNFPSQNPSISDDGTLVAFESAATNLISSVDANAFISDIFIRDLSIPAASMNHTTLVSLSAAGVQKALVSERPSVSGDGSRVAFSTRSSLVPGDTNGADDVFVRDRVRGTTERVSVRTFGAQAPPNEGSLFPAISFDGRFVAFMSQTDTFVADDTNGVEDIFVRGPE